MTGPEAPGSPPPEVPEDYLAAYHEAYQRALGEVSAPEPAPAPVTSTARVATPVSRPAREAGRKPGWLPVALLVGLALVLVLGAYGVGRLFSSGTEANSPGHSTAPAPTTPSKSESQETSPSAEPVADAWEGEVVPVVPTGAKATCRARPSVDSAGQPVRYGARNTLDGDPTTAWRCNGTAIGERLRLTLPVGTEVAEVGIIPGYAKTDPASGTDRYAENNRITRVRWTLGDGVVVVQKLDPDPKNREVQTIRVPATRTGSVTLEILAVARGARNTTAISELVAAAADD